METHDQWKKGGESREWLEIALAEAVERLGVEKNQHKKLRAPWRQDTVELDAKRSFDHKVGSERSHTSLAVRQSSQRESWW